MSEPPPSYEPAPPLPPSTPWSAVRATYQPLDGRLKALKIVFIVIAGISALAAISDVLEILLMNQLVAGEDVSDATLDANDARQGLFGMLQLLGVVGGAIVFIMWFHRAYENSDVVAHGTPRYSAGWAIGAGSSRS